MAVSPLTQTVIDAFNALADEVQALADHKIVLEHKLRFAHEQFQTLADKYAPAAPQIAKTLANLQPPPYHTPDESSLVPLLKRAPTHHPQHQVALIIRDGRRAATQLASLGEASKTTVSTRETTVSQPSIVEASMPTTLEQDFTVEGRKGRLQCPFSEVRTADDAAENTQPGNGTAPATAPDPAPAHVVSQDPNCPSLFEDSPSVNGAQAGICPIRFMDQRSPEEIAHYIEAHKHDIPRSHELCLRRYQRNEEQIKKLDSKYGNIVSMIEDLTQLHKPMLPEGDQARRRSVETRPSNDRVETWAQEVGASAGRHRPEDKPDPSEDPDCLGRSGQGPVDRNAAAPSEADDDRHSRFDRDLKEVRVGESPSRPWGISVPFRDPSGSSMGPRAPSPPPAPVRFPQASAPDQCPLQSTRQDEAQSRTSRRPNKCPFDHTKLSPFVNRGTPHDHHVGVSSTAAAPPTANKSTRGASPPPQAESRPAFIDLEAYKRTQGMPQMVFTGPVFIGYPMDQAIQFMNQYQPRQ